MPCRRAVAETRRRAGQALQHDLQLFILRPAAAPAGLDDLKPPEGTVRLDSPYAQFSAPDRLRRKAALTGSSREVAKVILKCHSATRADALASE